MEKKPVSLVLSSGGARGLAHIGAIEAILEHGFEISAISGTSMGALVGGVYASGNLPEFREFFTNLSKMDVLRLMDLAINKKGIIKGERVFTEMKRFVAGINIEDLPIPFTAVATDLTNHREVIFNHGCLLDAIRASAAVPTVLFPMMLEDILLVDGGIVNPLPLNRVNRKAGDLLIAVNLNAPRELLNHHNNSAEKKIYNKLRALVNDKWNGLTSEKSQRTVNSGFFDLLGSSLEMMQHKLTENALSIQQPDILVNIPVNTAEMFEFYRAADLIKTGYDAMNLQLNNYDGHIQANPGFDIEWHI